MTIPFEKPFVLDGVDFIVLTDGAGHYLQLPKLTTAQRDALSAVNGMMIYNTTTSRLEAYENGSWGALGGAGSFIDLTDTPSDYVGRGGDVVLVKTTEDGIETQPWPVVGTTINYFLTNNAADIGSYYYLYPTETGEAYSELTSSALSTGDDQLLWSFVTEAGEPGMDVLALGAYTTALFLEKTGNKDVRVYWKLFKRNTGGTEEILQSAASDYLTASTSQYVLSGYLNEDQALDTTDRLVLKLYANVSGTGTDVTVKLTMEGDYDSRLTINILSSAFNLDRLSDVTISSPADDEVLAYDSGSGKWINQTSAGGSSTFIGLTDTPSAFTGKAGYSPTVNVDEDALEWAKRTPITTEATTIYIDTGGSDSTGDGSSSTPFATPGKAISWYLDNATVISHACKIALGKGTYTLSSELDLAGLIISGSLEIIAQDTSDNALYDSGAATGGSTTYLDDTSKSWATDQWNGGWVAITKGTGAGQIAAITDTAATRITASFSVAPDATSEYIISMVKIDGDSAVENCFSAYAIDNVSFVGLYITGATKYGLLWYYGTGLKIVNCIISAHYGVRQWGGQAEVQAALFKADTWAYRIQSVAHCTFAQDLGYGTTRGCCFKASSSGSGRGLYMSRLAAVFLYTADNVSTFLDWDIGIYAEGNSVGLGATDQVFSGCSTDYTPDLSEDNPYLS